jgi:fatty-acyl-CoA synthase
MIVPLTPLRCLHRAVDLYGKKTGVVCGERRFTYAEFGERCQRLASALEKSGIRPGDRVAYLSFNNHQLLEGYFGVIQAHAVVMPLNVRLSTLELIAIVNHSEARMLLFENDFAALVEQLRPACPCVNQWIGLDENYEQFIAQGHPQRADIFAYDETSIAELFYTSGSTGTPKGVTLSHRTVYVHAMSVALSFDRSDDNVELHTIPLFHANGWGRPQTSTLLGNKQVMVRRFDAPTVFRLIQEEKATGMSVVPAMANVLINTPDRGAYDLSSLRCIHIGGAASSPELIEKMEQTFHCECIAGYGLTETAPVATSARKKGTIFCKDEADRYRRQAMAGWPVPNVEIRVVDPEMRDVPRDMESIGEVVILGDHVMDGYFREPEATAAVMSGHWFHSGDMAIWDDEGYIQIVDRQKDIIISGGENISSIEVEKAISAHPAVFECAVVSAPDPKWGEVPVAIVTVKAGEKLTFEELIEFLRQRLAGFKLPRTIEFSATPLPKTGTGKIVKRALREVYWQGKSTRVQG